MFKYAFKLALRNLLKYPVMGSLNMLGLALGLAASFALLLFAYQELTYDRHFEDSNRIYRVATDFYNIGGFANSQEILHEYLANELPEVAYATGVKPTYRETPVQVSQQKFQETGVYHIDTAFFKVFSYSLKVTIVQVTHSEKNAAYGARIIDLLDGNVQNDRQLNDLSNKVEI